MENSYFILMYNALYNGNVIIISIFNVMYPAIFNVECSL